MHSVSGLSQHDFTAVSKVCVSILSQGGWSKITSRPTVRMAGFVSRLAVMPTSFRKRQIAEFMAPRDFSCKLIGPEQGGQLFAPMRFLWETEQIACEHATGMARQIGAYQARAIVRF